MLPKATPKDILLKLRTRPGMQQATAADVITRLKTHTSIPVFKRSFYPQKVTLSQELVTSYKAELKKLTVAGFNEKEAAQKLHYELLTLSRR